MEPKKIYQQNLLNSTLILSLMMLLPTIIDYVGIYPILTKTWLVTLFTYASLALIQLYFTKIVSTTYFANGISFSYAKSLVFAIIMGAGAAVVASICTQILYLYDPQYLEMSFTRAEEVMRSQNPNLTDENIEMGLSIAKKMTAPYIAIPVAIFGGALSATLAGLITSIFTRREIAKPIDQQ